MLGEYDRVGFWVLVTMPFVVQAGAEDLPWVMAILTKEDEHASGPRAIVWGIGRQRNGRV